ncbi:hypothetical protein D3C74_446720 [compost metagenome]
MPYADGFVTSFHVPPPAASQYWSFHALGTATPSPPVVVSVQKSIDALSTRTGASKSYCSHRLAGREPDQVPHRSVPAPPVKNDGLPSLTASTLFQPAV